MTHRTEGIPEMPERLRVALEAVESNAEVRVVGEVMERVKEIGAEKFPPEFTEWLAEQALNAIQNYNKSKSIMDAAIKNADSDADTEG